MPTIRQAAESIGIGYEVAKKIVAELGLGKPLGPGLPKVLTLGEVAQVKRASKERPKPGRRWPGKSEQSC